jgi:hypothetical protein
VLPDARAEDRRYAAAEQHQAYRFAPAALRRHQDARAGRSSRTTVRSLRRKRQRVQQLGTIVAARCRLQGFTYTRSADRTTTTYYAYFTAIVKLSRQARDDFRARWSKKGPEHRRETSGLYRSRHNRWDYGQLHSVCRLTAEALARPCARSRVGSNSSSCVTERARLVVRPGHGTEIRAKRPSQGSAFYVP